MRAHAHAVAEDGTARTRARRVDCEHRHGVAERAHDTEEPIGERRLARTWRASDADRVGLPAVGRQRRHRRAGRLVSGFDERQQARYAGALTASDALGEGLARRRGARQAFRRDRQAYAIILASRNRWTDKTNYSIREWLSPTASAILPARSSSPTTAPSSTHGSTPTTTSSRRVCPARNARRPHRPDAASEVDPVRSGLDAVRMAGASRRTGRLRRCCARSSARRSRRATSPIPGSSRSIEVLAPTVIDFAPPELAAEVVPRLLSGAEMWCQGFSEPGTGSDLASLSCRAVPDGDAAHGIEVGDQRTEGLDQPGPVLRALRAPHAHGTGRFAPPRHHRVLRRHGHARDHRLAARDDQRRARVRRSVLRRRRRPGRSDARRAERRLGRCDEHPPVRALLVLLAAHRVPLPAAPATRRRRTRRRSRGGDRRQRVRAAPRAARAVARHAAPTRRRSHARRGDVDRQGARGDRGAGDVRRRPPAPPRASSRSTTARPAKRGAANTCTRVPRRSTAAPRRCSATSSPAGSSTSGATE